MNFTRKQELYLINVGLSSVLNNLVKPVKRTKPKSRKWSRTQKTKFVKTMRKKWREKKNGVK